MNLDETLIQYTKSDIYPFHMPGHKRQVVDYINPYSIDMTEVDGVDDLHDPEGVIKSEQEKLSSLYNADASFILVGGSTSGNLAAIYAAVNENDKVIIQRNSHKSVYNAVTLRHCSVSYIYPKLQKNGIFEAVTLEMIKESIQDNHDVKAIVITSPTYEGYHCDIEKIARECHKNNVILIVDQAHGAHLGFEKEFTNSAANLADITIQSLHKTLPSLTQTAVLHIKGNRIRKQKIRDALDIFETSSPSYVLMQSVSRCISFLQNSDDKFKEYVDNLNNFYKVGVQLSNLEIVSESIEKKDPGKIVISTERTTISGVELASILRNQYKIETEMSSFGYVIAMTSVMDSKNGFDRLEKALLEIDGKLSRGKITIPSIDIRPKRKMELWEAKLGNEIENELRDSEGRVSATMICIYPPGSPIIVPGEIITGEAIELIESAKAQSLHVTGINGNLVSVVN